MTEKKLLDSDVRVLGQKDYKSNNLKFYNVIQDGTFNNNEEPLPETPVLVNNLRIETFFEKETNIMLLFTAKGWTPTYFPGNVFYAVYIDNLSWLESAPLPQDPQFLHYLLARMFTIEAGNHVFDVRAYSITPFPEFGTNSIVIEDGVLTVIELVK